MDSIQIKELLVSEARNYRNLVLSALECDHECFRISPNDDLDLPFVQSNTPDNFTLGAFDDAKLIGVVTFKRLGENREKLRHKGLLSRLIVSQEYRKKGVGKQLVAEVILRARKIEGIEQINLTVIPTNEQAKKLYEQFGFKTYASEVNAIKWKGQYFREDQMVLHF